MTTTTDTIKALRDAPAKPFWQTEEDNGLRDQYEAEAARPAPVAATPAPDVWALIHAYADARDEYVHSTARHLSKMQRENVEHAETELANALAGIAAPAAPIAEVTGGIVRNTLIINGKPEQLATACSACYGSGYGVDDKLCPCGCRPRTAAEQAKPEPVAQVSNIPASTKPMITNESVCENSAISARVAHAKLAEGASDLRDELDDLTKGAIEGGYNRDWAREVQARILTAMGQQAGAVDGEAG